MPPSSLENFLFYFRHGDDLIEWAVTFATFALIFCFLWAFRRFGSKFILRFTQKTTSRVDDIFPVLIQNTHILFLLIVSAFAATQFVALPQSAVQRIQTAAMLALIVQSGIWGSHSLSFLFNHLTERDTSGDGARRTSLMALRMLTRIAIWILVAALLLENLGFNMSAIITGLGIGGIAVALAVQNVLGDLLASLSIVLDKPFVVGDFVVVDSLSGTIEQIGVKTTRIRSLSGEQLVFSNSDLLKARIRNFKRMQERRILFTVGVTYSTPIEIVKKIPGWIEEIIKSQSEIRFDRAHFKEFGPYSLNFEMVYFLLNSEYISYMNVQQAINIAIAEKFAAEKIEFAFPTQTVHVAKEPC